MNINRRVSLLLVVFVGLLGLLSVFAIRPTRVSALCNGVSDLGAVEYDVSTDSLPRDGDLWLRLLPDTNGESLLKLELTNGDCVDVRLDQGVSSEWIWHNAYQFSDFVSESNSEVGKIKVVGVYGNVKLEKILITDKDCVPYADGANCLASNNRIEEDGVSYSLLSAYKGEVSGKVFLTDLSTDNPQITESRYMVDGKVVQRSKGFEAFDSTLVANGEHRIYMIFEGNTQSDVIREAIDVVVSNADNPFSAIVRHIKLNREVYIVLLSVLIASALLIAMIVLARQKRIQKRHRQVKGLDF